MTLIDALFVGPDTAVRDVIRHIDQNAKGIALVVDDTRRLLGTVTDGDIRRAILRGVDLAAPARVLLEARRSGAGPLTVPEGTCDADLLHLMNERTVRHIPIVDDHGRVVNLALLSDLAREFELPLRAVVMAGGYGRRLRPLTERVPKAMLPIGDRPLLELIVRQLSNAGVRRMNIATHYKGDQIARHFGDGTGFGFDIQYLEEEQPLGTAGALALLPACDEPLLVVNGDVLTDVDFRAMLHFHLDCSADMTVGVRQYEIRVPYGVVETNDVKVVGISEKPTIRHFINAGIYLLNHDVCRFIPTGERFDMPDLIKVLIENGQTVVSFLVREYWADVGTVEDYDRVISEKRLLVAPGPESHSRARE